MIRELVQYIDNETSLTVGTDLFAYGPENEQDSTDPMVLVGDLGTNRLNGVIIPVYNVVVEVKSVSQSPRTAYENALLAHNILATGTAFTLPILATEGSRAYEVKHSFAMNYPDRVESSDDQCAIFRGVYQATIKDITT